MMVAFSAIHGFLYISGKLSIESFYLFLAMMLLCMGAASLNSYQERKIDIEMSRTSNRPLVQKKLSHSHALIQSVFFIVFGLGILFYLGSQIFWVSLAGLILYNFIYTPLKKISIVALYPGAVSGAIPSYAGCLAAGADIFTMQSVLVFMLLFFWQLPHFFLIVLNHKKDYISSFSPNVLKSFTEEGLRRISLPWISALSTTMLCIATIDSSLGNISRLLLAGNALVIAIAFYHEILIRKRRNYKLLYICLNISIFLHMLIVCVSILV